MKHYQVEVEKNGCEHCGEGKMWVIVANGIAGGTSYSNEDQAVELCDELNDAFEAGRASVSKVLEEIRQVATGERQVGNDDTDGLDWIARRIADLNPPAFTGDSVHWAAFGDSPLTSGIE